MKFSKKSDNSSVEKGLGFGITSGVITTLGLIVGLDSATRSFYAIVGGIIAIAIADAFSDALGIHVSEESQHKSDTRHIWMTTVITFISKFVFALTFIVPFLIFDLTMAVYASAMWGFFVLIVYNYRLARLKKENPLMIISEHLLIAAIVIIITHYVGHVVQLLI